MNLSREKNRFFKNASFLLLAQGAGYVAPLLILGYLLKIFGVSGFGTYAFVFAVMAYLQVLIDYGFSFTASRDISRAQNDKDIVSNIFTHVTIIKLFTSGLVFLVGVIIFFMLISNEELIKIYLSAFFWMLGMAFMPTWYFQGVEKFRLLSVLNVLSKIIGCCLIFIFVKRSDHIWLAFFVLGVPNILAVVFSFLYILIIDKIKIVEFNLNMIKKLLIDGWYIFSASLSSVALTNSGVILLGVMYPPAIVGGYAAVERIMKAAVSVFSAFTQAAYPINCLAFKTYPKEALHSVWNTAKPILIAALLMAIAIPLMTNFDFIRVRFSEAAIPVVYILSLWLFFGVVNNILGIQILSAAGFSATYSQSFFVSTLIALTLIWPLCKFFQGAGASLTLLIGEFALSLMLFFFCRQKLQEFK